MVGFKSCSLRAYVTLLKTILCCCTVMFSSNALAQSQEMTRPEIMQRQSQSEPALPLNRDTATGDNPDLDIPDAVSAKPVSNTAQATSPSALITNQPLGSLIDRDVDAAGGGNLGHIVDVLIDVDGEMRAVVVDIGGFLGVGNRRVAVASALIQVSHSNPQAPVIILVSASVIRSAPEYKRGSGSVAVLTGPRLATPEQPADTPPSSSAETISVKTPPASTPSSPTPSPGE